VARRKAGSITAADALHALASQATVVANNVEFVRMSLSGEMAEALRDAKVASDEVIRLVRVLQALLG
jgi:hypothetical protein